MPLMAHGKTTAKNFAYSSGKPVCPKAVQMKNATDPFLPPRQFLTITPFPTRMRSCFRPSGALVLREEILPCWPCAHPLSSGVCLTTVCSIPHRARRPIATAAVSPLLPTPSPCGVTAVLLCPHTVTDQGMAKSPGACQCVSHGGTICTPWSAAPARPGRASAASWLSSGPPARNSPRLSLVRRYCRASPRRHRCGWLAASKVAESPE